MNALRALLRGGNFNNEADAGVFAANVNNAPSNSNYNIGFRAAKNKSQIGQAVNPGCRADFFGIVILTER